MGGAQDTLFEPQFNRSVPVQTTDHRITSNAGVDASAYSRLITCERKGEQFSPPGVKSGEIGLGRILALRSERGKGVRTLYGVFL